MSNIEQLKQAAREKFHDDFYFSGVKYKKDNKVWKDSLKESLVNKVLDEIVTSTYLQAVEAIEPIIRRHYKNGCDDKYRDECMEMILEELQSLNQTKE